MDPNATLKAMRELAAKIMLPDAFSDQHKAELADELAEHVEAIDGWLSKGGFLPAAWNHRHKPTRQRKPPRLDFVNNRGE